MRAAHTLQALGFGALLALTGCVSVQHGYSDDYDYGPPPYGAYYHPHDVDLVWDAHFGVYTVIGFPALYWWDGWYWRHDHGYWERCERPRGGHWARVDVQRVPERLHRRSVYSNGGGRRDASAYRGRPEPRERREERGALRREPVQAREVREERRPRDEDRFEERRRAPTPVRRDEARDGRPERGGERVERGPERRADRAAREVRPARYEPPPQRERAPARAEPRRERAPARAEPRRERRDEAREVRADQRHERREEAREARAEPRGSRDEPDRGAGRGRGGRDAERGDEAPGR